MPSFATSPGTRDILAPDSARWRRFQQVFADVVETAGFGHIIPPMFEDLGVFLRVGESTEIVTKEMYDFEDKGGRRVALRPEQTASVCRAFVEHRPVTPWKVWYAGPNFRYEKPQQGRYRQFDQVGVEVLGVDDPQLDAEVIALAMEFYRRLGLTATSTRPQLPRRLRRRGSIHRRSLNTHFSSNIDALSAESRATLERNPLRVLDSKRAEDAQLIAAAPRMADHLSSAAEEHFLQVQTSLRAAGVTFHVDDRLVRGLDYYRRTTFEFASESLTARTYRNRWRRSLRRSRRRPGWPGYARNRVCIGAGQNVAGVRRRGGIRGSAESGRCVRRGCHGRKRGRSDLHRTSHGRNRCRSSVRTSQHEGTNEVRGPIRRSGVHHRR